MDRMSSQARVSDFFPTVRSSTRKASGKRSTPSISKVKTAKVESMRETEELASPAKRRTSTTGSESKKVESSEPKPSSSKPVVQPPPNTFRRKLFAESGKQTTEDEAKPSTGEKVPAYKRLAYLTKKSTADESGELDLPLPYKYRKMLEVFKKIDYFAWVYLKRHETCTFEKLKQSIEQSTHRLFDQDSLLSILSVPGPKWFQLDRQVCKGKSQLTITPVYCDSNKCVNSATNLTEREKEYVRCLLELTRREHLKFLAEMKIQLPAGKSIFRWHPMFRLDSVPDIAPNRALLPKQEVTTDPNSILNYCIRKSKAQNEVVQPEPKPGEESSPVKRDKVKRGLLKGISVELLNKIRAKEASTLAKQMLRSPETDRQILMLGHLPEIVRIVQSCFVGTSQRTIAYDQLVCKVVDSYHSAISPAQADKHLEFLLSLELAAQWIQVIRIHNDRFVRVNKHFPLHDLFRSIKSRIEELQAT